MAYINDYYIFVETEDITRNVSASEHPVEKGLPLTDNVRFEPRVITLKGEIVGPKYNSIKSKIQTLMEKGKLVSYSGVNRDTNLLITKFNTGSSSKIKGGCSLNMELRKIRIAKSPYKATPAKSPGKKTTSAGTQQVKAKEKKKRYYTVKKGDCLWNIAKSYYGNGALYSKIVKANKGKIKNPNVIQIGWRIEIPY